MRKPSNRLLAARECMPTSLPKIDPADISVLDRIAAGATSSVYEVARQSVPGRFALKVLMRDDLEVRLRFVIEARALARVRHPNVVGIFGELTSPGERPCILMPLLRGETLRSRLDTCGSVSEARAVEIIRGVLSGLDASHRAGILHRDLSPRNVFLGRAAGEPADAARTILLDFGLAKLRMDEPPSDLSCHYPARGNLAYMAPEQILGERADMRTDVYSAGILLFEAIAGRPPFTSADPDEVAKAHLDRRPPRLDRVAHASPDIARIVDRALAKRASDRFATAREFASELLSAGASRTSQGTGSH